MSQYGAYNNELTAAFLMAASAKLSPKKTNKKSNFGIAAHSKSQNKKTRSKRRMIKASKRQNRN
jgi:hypothetical protein